MIKHLQITAIAMLGILSLQAQVDKDDLAIVQAIVTKSKKATVSSYLKIDHSPEHEDFWQLYDSYELKRKRIMADRFEILNEYLANVNTLDNAGAARISTKVLSSDLRMNKLNKNYFKKLQKQLGGIQATELLQLEYYMQAAITAKFQAQNPVFSEADKKGLKEMKFQIDNQSL